ncbi:hypothetical protein NDN08_001646 [Rhodosorus marinus]|uniref:Protein Lines N-terminal domain-containing protein n=1 Tax=Rhodosorus marinus TaxID=101924 RepID=A0AAV8URG3_9RHOD|nr:hypothetical protein NDN08_001646 [Rhodosorus marinus]
MDLVSPSDQALAGTLEVLDPILGLHEGGLEEKDFRALKPRCQVVVLLDKFVRSEISPASVLRDRISKIHLDVADPLLEYAVRRAHVYLLRSGFGLPDEFLRNSTSSIIRRHRALVLAEALRSSPEPCIFGSEIVGSVMGSETLFVSLAASPDSLCLYAMFRFGRKALTYTSDQDTATRLGELCIRTDSEDLPLWVRQRSMELLRLVLNRCSVLPGKVRTLPQKYAIQAEDHPRCYFAAAPKEVAHRIAYRTWLLVLFKMVEIYYSFHEHQELDLTVEEDVVTSTDIFEVFSEQDDQLVESILIGMQLWILIRNLPDSEELVRTKQKYQCFDPDVMIARFLDFIDFDTSLVCDWCFSNETETLRLLLMYLRNSVNPDGSVVALFRDLISAFQRLRAHHLWPFDVSPLLRRIETYCSRFEDRLDA